MRKMNPEVKTLVLEAARSGKYRQGTGVLNRRKPHERTEYCILGLVCELAHEAGVVTKHRRRNGHVRYGRGKNLVLLPPEVMRWANLTDVGYFDHQVPFTSPSGRAGILSSLVALNDKGFTFEQIADIIEEHL